MTVSIDKAVISRLYISGKKFEILVDPEKAWELKRGGKVDIAEILAYPAIYKDVRSTECVPESDLQKFFGTTDVFKIAERIIKEGELQLTSEQKRKMVEQKRNQIASIIAKKGINPQTNTPHPPQRILNVMEKAGVNIDPFMDAELQVEKVLEKIKPLIPIKFQKLVIQLKIPPQHAGKAYSVIKRSWKVVNEEWLNDGSLRISVELFAGVQSELFDKISSLTHGQFESKVLRREDL